MSGSYLQTIILYCLNRINGERSIYSVFHILKGKKSSQTLQDGHLFQIAYFFQSYHFITREEFDKIIAQSELVNWIQPVKEQHYLLSAEGKKYLEKQLAEKPFPTYLNGWTYHSLTDAFWGRLSLLVQVCSNVVHNNSQYIPIQGKHEIQSWVKKFLNESSKSWIELAEQLYRELIVCFEKEKSINPSVVVIRLTGHNNFGLTSQQAAVYLGHEFTYYHLEFNNVLHYLLKSIQDNPVHYQLLFSIIKDLNNPFSFTISTKKTYALLKSGLTIEQIALIRKLKRSTIEDHIVEIAFNDKQFDITPFVPSEKQNVILKSARKIGSKQLKQIRELTNNVDYFEIRLVMAKFGEQ